MNKLLALIIVLNAFSYVQAIASNNTADNYFLKKENTRLMAENSKLREAMGIGARGILPYDERIRPEQILANSTDLNVALKEERKELEAAKAKMDQPKAQDSFFYSIAKDVCYGWLRDRALSALTGATSSSTQTVAKKTSSVSPKPATKVNANNGFKNPAVDCQSRTGLLGVLQRDTFAKNNDDETVKKLAAHFGYKG